jgi:hypothetical protein
MYASEKGHTEVVKLLLTAAADKNVRDKVGGRIWKHCRNVFFSLSLPIWFQDGKTALDLAKTQEMKDLLNADDGEGQFISCKIDRAVRSLLAGHFCAVADFVLHFVEVFYSLRI